MLADVPTMPEIPTLPDEPETDEIYTQVVADERSARLNDDGLPLWERR